MSPEATSPKDYLKGRLQQLTDFVNDPRAAEALAEGRVHPARGLVLRAVMATPGLPEFLYNRAYTRRYQAAGHEILGVGHHAVTVADGAHKVRKFYRKTAGLSEAEQQHHVTAMQHKQSSTLAHLEPFAIPQEFFIQEDPLNPSQSVVAATQARVAIKSGLNFYTGAPPIDTDLSPFVASALEMQTKSSPTALPDLVGVNNLVLEADTGAILLIDPISLHANDPDDALAYNQAQRVLERLSANRQSNSPK